MTTETPGGVVKIIELVGSSTSSFSDAVRNAVRTASKTIRNIRGVDVLSSSAQVEDGDLINYKVNCKLAFLVEDEDAGERTGGDRAATTANPSTAPTGRSVFGNPPPSGGGTTPVGPS